MLFLSLFLSGFTLGVFFALRVFAPERQEDLWDPQFFSETRYLQKHSLNKENKKSRIYGATQIIPKRRLLSTNNI